MSTAGFVLAGGLSSRMGRDKALLEIDGVPLVVRTAREVCRAAGSATLVAPPERYARLGWPIIADRRPGTGPLGGIETALSATTAEWNLVVACDMPHLRASFLTELLRQSQRRAPDCLLVVRNGLPEPLLAVYRRTCLTAVAAALDAGVRKVTNALGSLQVIHFNIDDPLLTVNLNSPEDWRELQNG
jgi:molybdopterin-guanine dinucleotide biosynthesis protein A